MTAPSTLTSLDSLEFDIARNYAQRVGNERRTIGANLREIRGDREQQLIAARMGVKQTRVSNWERGRYKKVSSDTLLRLAKGYETSVERILQGIDPDYDAMLEKKIQSRTPPVTQADVQLAHAANATGGPTGGVRDQTQTYLQQPHNVALILAEAVKFKKAVKHIADELAGIVNGQTDVPTPTDVRRVAGSPRSTPRVRRPAPRRGGRR